MFDIQNRRYTGNKHKLMPWISKLIFENCKNCHSFFDVFAGTGSVSNYLYDYFDRFILNDFLYSNEIIYNAFFLNELYNEKLLFEIKNYYNEIEANNLKDNYVSINYGNKFFNYNDAKKIGYIRENIEIRYKRKEINYKEYAILVTSLLYSLDKIANTCGHYDAYRKIKNISESFIFELINPKKFDSKKLVEIYRCDSNKLANEVKCDIAYIDPPYNSRQYSRFYHVLENITQWKKPELYGVALKPKEENMSDYCKTSAPIVFNDLIQNLNVKYIVVSYNNTYDSKSSSSKNKITLEEIETILSNKGETRRFEKRYKAFTTGKTEMNNHKEYIFITKVKRNIKKEISYRSPLFYVGDKYKLMPEIKKYLPSYINTYVEPFVGGGSSFLNVKARKYLVNDINSSIIDIHKMLYQNADDKNEFFNKIFKIINHYGLSCSYNGHLVPESLKQKYKKTYYAKYNKEQYLKLREDFNNNKTDTLKLYLLLIYGFNHMTRFNKTGEFNLPVGNVDFNSNVYNSLNYYFDYIKNTDITYFSMDYKDFIKMLNLKENDYVLLDPPYLISQSEYNKIWNEKYEKELYKLLDELNARGIRFGITNLVYHKGNKNEIFESWSKKYFVHELTSNYISYNDNSIKNNSKEVFVTNYDKGNDE